MYSTSASEVCGGISWTRPQSRMATWPPVVLSRLLFFFFFLRRGRKMNGGERFPSFSLSFSLFLHSLSLSFFALSLFSLPLFSFSYPSCASPWSLPDTSPISSSCTR